jgi:hypothetical protein
MLIHRGESVQVELTLLQRCSDRLCDNFHHRGRDRGRGRGRHAWSNCGGADGRRLGLLKGCGLRILHCAWQEHSLRRPCRPKCLGSPKSRPVLVYQKRIPVKLKIDVAGVRGLSNFEGNRVGIGRDATPGHRRANDLFQLMPTTANSSRGGCSELRAIRDHAIDEDVFLNRGVAEEFQPRVAKRPSSAAERNLAALRRVWTSAGPGAIGVWRVEFGCCGDGGRRSVTCVKPMRRELAWASEMVVFFFGVLISGAVEESLHLEKSHFTSTNSQISELPVRASTSDRPGHMTPPGENGQNFVLAKTDDRPPLKSPYGHPLSAY